MYNQIHSISSLTQVLTCFRKAGRDDEHFPVFLACFGNKPTDAEAYLAVGSRKETTFIINSSSAMRALSGLPDALASYDDPALVDWLVQLMQLMRSGHLPRPPD
jgi:hypothetical protein